MSHMKKAVNMVNTGVISNATFLMHVPVEEDIVLWVGHELLIQQAHSTGLSPSSIEAIGDRQSRDSCVIRANNP